MHPIILAALSGTPNTFKAGWDSVPSATGGPHDTGLVMLVLVALIVVVIWGGLKKLAG
jgi:hypothetical protein